MITKSQVVLDTENENVKIVLRTSGTNVLQTIKQVSETSGEVPTGESITVETVTITRTLLTIATE